MNKKAKSSNEGASWGEKLKNSVENHPLVVIVTVTIFLASQITTLTQGVVSAWAYYSNTIGWRALEEEKINSLSVSMSLENFVEILGIPLFRRKESNYIEYIFRRRGYWVQAITKGEDESLYSGVVLYSVTTCDESFKPTIQIPFFSGEPIQLGMTTFKAASETLSPSPALDYYISGATANSYILEEHYLGNPGKYQTVYYAYNDACPNSFDQGIRSKLFDLTLKSGPTSLSIDNKIVDEFRSRNSFNTYAITAPAISRKDLSDTDSNRTFQIGVDRIQVRVFPDMYGSASKKDGSSRIERSN